MDRAIWDEHLRRALKKHGVSDINAVDADERNALLIRVLGEEIWTCNLDAVIYLLEFGEELNGGDKSWLQNNLDISSVKLPSCGLYPVTILVFLLRALPNRDKRNALLVKFLRDTAWEQNARFTERLIVEFGIDLSSDDINGADILYKWVNGYDNSDEKRFIIESLLEGSADPNRPYANIGNRTPLHAAAEKGSIDLMKLLVSHKADITKEDNDGLNPVVYGFRNGIDFTEKMYEGGLIDFLYHNSKGENYLMLFLQQGPSIEDTWSFLELAGDIDFSDSTNDGKTVFDYFPRYDNGRLKKGYKQLEKAFKDEIKDKYDTIDDFSDIGF